MTFYKALFATLLFCCFINGIKAQELEFTYDAAGNQTERKWICGNCTQFQLATTSTTLKSDFIAETAKLNSPVKDLEQKVIAYPNPLTETLNIEWIPVKKSITQIEVYSTSGVSIFKKSYGYTELDFHEMIHFTQMTAGMYVVKVTFSDGKQELLKVIKL